LLRIGRLATFFVRHGASVDEAAAALGLGRNVCRLALAFYHSLDGLKLRALVEGWDMLTILRRLREPRWQPRTARCSRTTGIIRQAVRDLTAPRALRPKFVPLHAAAAQ
jgi:hypothetical protein